MKSRSAPALVRRAGECDIYFLPFAAGLKAGVSDFGVLGGFGPAPVRGGIRPGAQLGTCLGGFNVQLGGLHALGGIGLLTPLALRLGLDAALNGILIPGPLFASTGVVIPLSLIHI